MALYAVGDIQGCYDQLRRLLDQVSFNPSRDRLWVAGDLVNRGPKSLEVLRYLKGLGKRAVCVLGNHDLHLLAVAQGNLKHYRNGGFDDILGAPDWDSLMDWLRRRPLLHHNANKHCTLIHAGLPPQWDLATARARAREVERALRGDGFPQLMAGLYGNEPVRWSDDLQGLERLRFIINSLTRARYCKPDGTLGLTDKGPPGTQQPGFLPWFDVPGRASAGQRIICGHWSTLGLLDRHDVWSLDTGCIWGGSLTLVRVHRTQRPRPVQLSCAELAAA